MYDPTLEPLVRRLGLTADLEPGSASTLRDLPFQPRSIAKAECLYGVGATDMPCFVLLDGCFSRFKQGNDDGRSIVSFELPGDIINVESLLLGSIDCGAQAVCQSTVAVIERDAITQARQSSRTLEVALWRSACIKAASLEEWLLNIGRRPPIGRLSHLFCEIRTRLIVVGLPEEEAAKLHLSPRDLADAMGLQQVIVTRCLYELASRNLIALPEGLIVIRDAAGLAKVGDFKSDYLHLNG